MKKFEGFFFMENIADSVSIAFYSIKKRKKIINKLKKIESINLSNQ